MRCSKRIYRIIGCFALVISIFCFTDFYDFNISKAKQIKTIRVGGDARFAPYDYIDENGTYKGFNVDIMNAIAIEMGFNVEFVPMSWEECLKALKEKRVDVLEGTSKTEDKMKVFDFTETTSNSYQVIWVRKDTTYVTGLNDLKYRKVAVQAGDVNEELLKTAHHMRLVRTESQEEGLKKLIDGEVDALLGSKLINTYFLQKNDLSDRVKIVGETLHTTEYGMATLKGNDEVLNLLNNGLEKIKENGTYDKIHNKWFGQTINNKNDFLEEIVVIGLIVISGILAALTFITLINRKLKAMVEVKTQELIKVNSDLRESEENYKRLFEISPDAVFVHNKGEILYASKAAVALTGVKDIEELKGMSIYQFISSQSFKEYEEIIDGLKEEKTITINNEKARGVDGKVVDVEIRITPFVEKGQTLILSIFKDITDKKLLDEALEYDKIKTEFFANISHEFRTPLNVILTTIQLVEFYRKNGVLEIEKKLDRYIGTMKQNSYRLLRLVSNLIDITKMDSGFFRINMENYNIVGLIEDITLSVAEYIENKGIELIFDTEVEERIIACDPDKIERIMLNLLSNSVKFTPEGGRITVNILNENETIKVSIKDTGIGVPEDKLDTIFERFRQVDKSTTRNHEGSGIGLSLVKSLVEMHEGNVSIKSKIEYGTEIVVELPAKVLNGDDKVRTTFTQEGSVERINIEFSDIYS
jgi:PAS domain S-box-containing protein